MDYELIRSDRRSIGLEVRSDGSLLVRAPKRLPAAEIDRVVAQRASWIEKHVKRQLERAKDADVTPLSDDEVAELYRKGLSILPGKVERFSVLMGVRPTNVTITAARKRHGSCSGKNALCFSYLLMQYPDELIDLVVAHELAHIRHKNHGSQFYAFLASVIPDYRDRMARMRELDLRGLMRR